MLTAFVGCAGVGKNTIIRELICAYPDRYEIFPTLTTRDMRPGEVEGDPYHFVTKERFEQLLSQGEIYEWQIIHDGNYYGGSREVLRKHLAGGKTLIKDIDVLGAKTYKEKLSDITKILSLFLYVEDLNKLLDRMRGRGDSEESIKIRAERFPMEMALSVDCDYMVSNDVVADTTAQVNCLLMNEETLGGLYRPVSGTFLPSEEGIRAEIDLFEHNGRFEPVELVFNGEELLLKDGVARYIAARRTNQFIQKKIRTLTDETLKPCFIGLEAWEQMIRKP